MVSGSHDRAEIVDLVGSHLLESIRKEIKETDIIWIGYSKSYAKY